MPLRTGQRESLLSRPDSQELRPHVRTEQSSRVMNLTGLEIWLFIVGRVLVGFGLGTLVIRYWPRIFAQVGTPVIVAGMLLMTIAAKELFRRTTDTPD